MALSCKLNAKCCATKGLCIHEKIVFGIMGGMLALGLIAAGILYWAY